MEDVERMHRDMRRGIEDELNVREGGHERMHVKYDVHVARARVLRAGTDWWVGGKAWIHRHGARRSPR